ncbi:apyrase isoform X1 [Bemisia tabaci]|uniref:apyrase isoform X1 n=1 Tax=Bemisia tabaci TaxID=7038 RepID=UPI003B288B78
MFVALCVVLCGWFLASVEGAIEVSIIHFNDFHARFEPVNPVTGGICEKGAANTCMGGFARMHAKILELKNQEPNSLVINAGDVSTGTLWYNLFKWNVTAEFMNLLPVDAQIIGNHEFDIDGPKGVLNYLSLLQSTPTVLSNVDCTKVPDLLKYLSKWIIVNKNGLRIGIVGYVAKMFPTLENTGDLIFEDEVEATNKAIKELRDHYVDVVVAISHTGYLEDVRVARQGLDADIIVGGHSHTFLYTGTPPLPSDKPAGPYPKVITQQSGRKVIIVQASAFSKYVGFLKVKFEKVAGQFQVSSWEGNPILLDKTVRTHPFIEEKLQPWRSDVEIIGSRVVGKTLVDLDATNAVCHSGACTIGKLITDAMVHEYTKQREGRSWTRASVAVLHAGGIRTSIPHGNITFGNILTLLPFEDRFGIAELSGRHFKEILEFSVELHHSPFLQMSGVKATFDMTKPTGERVSDILVRCSDCSVPTYEPLLPYRYYRIIMSQFMYRYSVYDQIKKRARYWESVCAARLSGRFFLIFSRIDKKWSLGEPTRHTSPHGIPLSALRGLSRVAARGRTPQF